jgi:hypothetical protein
MGYGESSERVLQRAPSWSSGSLKLHVAAFVGLLLPHRPLGWQYQAVFRHLV